MQTSQTRTVAERLAEVFTTKNVGIIDEVVDEAVVCHSLAEGPRGREMYRQLISWADHTLGGATWEVLALLADGDQAVLHVRLSGRHTGHFLGVPPTGREFSAEQVYIYRIRDGLVTDYWLVRDDIDALLQIGAIQSPWRRAQPA
jgi:predicted ester cyclase